MLKSKKPRQKSNVYVFAFIPKENASVICHDKNKETQVIRVGHKLNQTLIVSAKEEVAKALFCFLFSPANGKPRKWENDLENFYTVSQTLKIERLGNGFRTVKSKEYE